MEIRARMRRFGFFSGTSALVLALIGTLTAPRIASAAEVTISVARSESSFPSGYKGELVAIVDEDERDGTQGPIKLFRYTDTRNTKLEYTVADLRKGMVLIRALGRDLMKMRSAEFDAASGGTIEVVFHREFLGNDVRKVDLGFRMETENGWTVRTEDQNGRDAFNLIRLQVGLKFGAPTYVKEIRLFDGEFDERSLIRNYDARELPRAKTALIQ